MSTITVLRSRFVLICSILFPGTGAAATAREPAGSAVAAARGDGSGRLGSDARSLYLRAGRVDLRQKASLLAHGVVFEAERRYVIQLDGPMTRARRALLDTCGVQLGDYLPMYAYVARLGGVEADALIDSGFVTWVGPYEQAWKLSPQLGQSRFPPPGGGGGAFKRQRRLVAFLFSNGDVASAVASIERHGASARGADGVRRGGGIVLEIADERVERLRDVDEIMFVEEAAVALPRNENTAWI